MQIDIDKEVALLQRMTVGQLREKFEETGASRPTLATSSGSSNASLGRCSQYRRRHLTAGQASRRGTRSRYRHPDDCPQSHQAIPEVDGRHRDGIRPTKEDNRLPPPRSEIERVYKGEKIVVLVLDNGFEYEGAIYKTLSAVAKKITGQHCNGYHFFKLNKKGGDK